MPARVTQRQNERVVQPPTLLARTFVRYLLGFGVGVSVGLAPFLGKVDIPGFDALASLIPDTLQATTFPISAFVMGSLAVWIQWKARERFTHPWLRRTFRKTLWVLVACGLMFLVIQSVVVVRIRVPAVSDTVSFLVGFSRPSSDNCASVSASTCILRLSFNPARIADHWGDRQLQIAGLSLLFSYLLTTGSFGVMIGLLLLQERLASKPSPRRRANSASIRRNQPHQGSSRTTSTTASSIERFSSTPDFRCWRPKTESRESCSPGRICRPWS